MKKLLTRESVKILAPLTKVWDILVKPHFIREWEDFVSDSGKETDLDIGREITWHGEEGRYLKGTVTAVDPHSMLQVTLFDSSDHSPSAPEDFSYTYHLSQEEDHVLLSITMGDFAKLPGGDRQYKEVMKFDSHELHKIKMLAENNGKVTEE